MGRQRKGSVVEKNGKLYARVQFIDEQGQKRDIWRRAETRKEARNAIKKLLREVDDHGARTLDSHTMTFTDLAGYFEQHYLKPAEYVDGRKTSGYRSLVSYKCFLQTLRSHFGKKKLRTITYGDLRTFKTIRLQTPVKGGGKRSLASVHRELALLSRMLKIAYREGWIPRNPMNSGESLISLADETKRERILTREDERKILDACVGYRAHLRPVLVFLLDTGCRQGEAFKLRWRDVDFENGLITLQAFNTKTSRERQVAITTRLYEELARLYEKSENRPDGLGFGITSNIRRSFTAVCEAAGIKGLRRHDLRHTHATRLDDLNFSLAKIGGQLGHTKLQTTIRYVNRDKSAIKRVAAALDAFNVETTNTQQSELLN